MAARRVRKPCGNGGTRAILDDLPGRPDRVPAACPSGSVNRARCAPPLFRRQRPARRCSPPTFAARPPWAGSRCCCGSPSCSSCEHPALPSGGLLSDAVAQDLIDRGLFNDAFFYHRTADLLAGGYGFASNPGVPTAQWPPVFPFLLSLIYRVTGPDPLAGELFNAVVGALTVALLYLLARRLFDRLTATIAAGFLAILPGLDPVDRRASVRDAVRVRAGRRSSRWSRGCRAGPGRSPSWASRSASRS